ncbi:MAG: DUF2149 domain-containing protein [Methanophagales archaeon]|nr:DUF2149 domain-containing protein [Methanophagales archaeon]
MARRRRYSDIIGEEEDPMRGLANLFDVAMAFAVILLIAFAFSSHLPELLSEQSKVTIVKNPGEEDMEIIIKDGKEIKHLEMTNKTAGGRGKILGTAYKLETGEIIYVPVELEREEKK